MHLGNLDMRPKDSQRKSQQTLRTNEHHCHDHCPDYLALVFSVKELEMPPRRMIVITAKLQRVLPSERAGHT